MSKFQDDKQSNVLESLLTSPERTDQDLFTKSETKVRLREIAEVSRTLYWSVLKVPGRHANDM